MGGNALILLSGGLDSTAAILYYIEKKYNVSALFVDYGQAEAIQERSAAKKVAKTFNIKLSEVEISGFKFSSKEYVPARNSFLLTIALAHFKEKSGVIAIGIHSGTNYPDCSPIFVASMQKLFDIYNGGGISVGTPFLTWNKADVVNFAVQKKIPLDILCSSNIEDFRRGVDVVR